MSDILNTSGGAQSSLLIELPRTYSYWWCIIPALPMDRRDPQYAALKRLWADHTMNCLAKDGGAWKLSSSRGFYVQKREDYITPALFQIWSAFPDCSWVGPLLDPWQIPHGTIKRVNWSYSWEQKRDRTRRPDIIDIVLNWEDEEGQAIVAIEAKRRGGKLSEKDLNGGLAYLQLPSIMPFKRKWVTFLVAEADIPSARSKLPPGTMITTWESVGELQMTHASGLPISAESRELVCSYIAKHFADLDMPLSSSRSTSDDVFVGSSVRYDAVRALKLPTSIERFLLGSEAVFCARSGRMPEAPLDWLKTEPSFVDIVAMKSQSTADREKPHWRLSLLAH